MARAAGMSLEEIIALGGEGKAMEMMARELNQMTGPTAMMIPTQGFSEIDKPGAEFYDPEGREAFIEAFKRNVGSNVQVIEFDLDINDPPFAEEVVTLLEDMMKSMIEPTPSTGSPR